MRRPVIWTGHSADQRLRASTEDVWDQWFITSITGAEQFASVDNPATIPLVHHQQPGDVLRVTTGSLTYSVIVSDSAQAETPHSMSISTGAVTVGNASQDLVNTNQPFLAQQLARPAFVMGGQEDLPADKTIPNTDITGSNILNTLGPAQSLGSPYNYGPASRPLGLGGVATLVADGHFTAPSQLSLAPFPIVLIELVEPQGLSSKHEVRTRVGDTAPTILAKLIITNGFARISEEMTH